MNREQMIELASQSLRGENDWSEDFIEMASPKMADFAIEQVKAERKRIAEELREIAHPNGCNFWVRFQVLVCELEAE